MIKPMMSRATAGVLRGLILRSGVERNRILLSVAQSEDWQSLTFVGERHRLVLRISGADSREVAARLSGGLGDAEFRLTGAIVADIAVEGQRQAEDGTTELTIEALTVGDD